MIIITIIVNNSCLLPNHSALLAFLHCYQILQNSAQERDFGGFIAKLSPHESNLSLQVWLV